MASVDTEYLGRIVARLLERVPLFKGLTQAALLSLLNTSRLKKVSAGGEVFREGDRSSSIFVILRGSVVATRDIYENAGATVCVLEAGECFGEMALADRLPRSASVKARENSLLCALSVDAINNVPEVAKVIYANLASTLAMRCIAQEDALAAHLQANCRATCFQLIASSAAPAPEPLGSFVLKELLRVGRSKSVAAGQQIVKTGQTGQTLYILLEGEAEVSRGQGKQRHQLARLGSGACFGEIGFLNGSHGRIAEVTAVSDSQVLRIDVNDLCRGQKVALPVYQHLARMLSARLRGFNQMYAQLAIVDCFSDCPHRAMSLAA